MDLKIGAKGGRTGHEAAPDAYLPVLPLWLLRTAAAYLVAIKLLYSAIVPPDGDEAYYWLWGQHPQLSYLDHAPLVGWESFIGMHLLGWSPLALHFIPLVSFAIIALLLRLWARYLAPEHWQHFFWASLAIFLASPLMFAISTLLYPDEILLPTSLLAMTLLALFLADWEKGIRRWHFLYLGAGFLGLALLAKYNGALVGLGFVLALALRPKLRPLFASPQLYLAGLVTALFLLPVLIWNLNHDFDGLRFHAVDRFENRGEGFSPLGVGVFLLESVLYLSPFLVWPLIKYLLARRLDGFAGAAHAMGRAMLIASTLALTALASWTPAAGQVAPHWNIVGLLPFVPLAALFIRSRWLLAAHLAYGAFIATLAMVYFGLAPLPMDALGFSDGEAVLTLGQDQLAIAARAEAKAQGADFIATLSYSSAAQLAFAAGSGNGITSISPVLDQFDLWTDPASLAGKTALVVIVWPGQLDIAKGLFTSLQKVGDVTTQRLGHRLWTFGLYVGHGYRPAPAS